MRRNLLIAQTLAASSLQPVILMVAEAREACALAVPPGVDCLALPALRKEVDGQMRARYLDLGIEDLKALRAKTILAALDGFAPDVLIVDNVPRGALRELEPTLAHLRTSHQTRCVLGLRDVLDDPEVVRQEWSRLGNEEILRDFYDAIWIYGDPVLYDPVREYGFSVEIAAKVRYTGYLDQRMRLVYAPDSDADPLEGLGLPDGRLALCLVGGGQDGAQVAEAFAQAVLPPDMNGVIVTGPYMDPEVRQRLRDREAEQARLRVLEFVNEPTRLLKRADCVVAMGGYNTVCELLSFEKRALVVPRVKPRREQIIRAERLQDMDLIDMLHPDTVSPAALSQWLARDLSQPVSARQVIDMHGLTRLSHLLADVLAAPRMSAGAAA
jgi:predicted glycosyltransferase